jgi:hypothetical protein
MHWYSLASSDHLAEDVPTSSATSGEQHDTVLAVDRNRRCGDHWCCSRHLERDVEELGWRFTVLETFGNDAKRKGLDAGHRFITILPVAQHAGQRS